MSNVKIQMSSSLRVKFRNRSAILVKPLVTTTSPSYRTRSLILDTGRASFTRDDSSLLSSDHCMLAIMFNCADSTDFYLPRLVAKVRVVLYTANARHFANSCIDIVFNDKYMI